MRKEIEKDEELLIKSYYLAWTYEFFNVNFRKDRVEEYLKKFIEEDKDLEINEFLIDGIKYSITPLLLELIIEKLKIFEKKQNDEDIKKIANIVLEMLAEGYEPWDIPFFKGIFIRQILYHPLFLNKKVFNMIYEYIPKNIKTPEEKKLKEDIPKGYKRTDSGLIVPE